MTTITRAQVLCIASEFSSLPEADPRWAMVLAEAGDQVDDTAWGARATYAACLLAAHILSTIVAPELGASPAVQSVSAGGVSKTFALGSWQITSPLQNSSYGEEYERMLGTLVSRVGCVL